LVQNRRAKNTPTEIIRKLNYEINAALASPVMKARIADFGGSTLCPRLRSDGNDDAQTASAYDV
jgi:hypothetical protein